MAAHDRGVKNKANYCAGCRKKVHPNFEHIYRGNIYHEGCATKKRQEDYDNLMAPIWARDEEYDLALRKYKLQGGYQL